MKYVHLGRSGLRVSRLCLGTMNFGPRTEEPQAFAIMDRAHEQGLNFFDTANVYGRSSQEQPGGRTEEIVGRWFAQGGGRRERTVLATKVYGNMGTTWPNEDKLSALNIRRSAEASLRRLQTDYIDLYQMHHVDRDTPWEEIWEAMEVLRYQGKVLYFGSSNFAGWHIAKAQEAAARRNFMGLVSEQSLYNLFVREIEMDVLPAAIGYGVGVIAWSPLQGGLLGGILSQPGGPGRRFEDNERAQETLRREHARVEAYEKLCRDLGHEPGVVALAWVLGRPGLTGPIIGPRTSEQLDSALRALDVTLDEGTLADLDKIFPPHKTSPEDYAW
jgi:aryl-alcohol dehydrogenase-like predicted oxidoreductase